MTCVIFPTALGVAMIVLVTELESLGARDDLDQLLGDHRLAGAVISQRLLADHFPGIARRVVHRAHARALLGRSVFQKRTKYLDRQIAWQQLVKYLFFLRLVFVRLGNHFALFKYRR